MTRIQLPFLQIASLAGLCTMATPSFAGGGCGPDGQILTQAELLNLLGGNAVVEDFETFNIGAGTTVNLDVTCVDANAIANGQGPGLVEPGASYCDPSGVQMQWSGDQFFQRTTKTINANGSTGALHITYSASVTAMGVDLSAFSGFGYTGTATIYDTANAVVGSVNFTLVNGGSERFFVGWAHSAGIGRVEITSPAYAWSPKIDDSIYGVCGGLGTKYCTANANSTGSPSDISASGSASSGAGNLTLTAIPVPNQSGIFFHGMNQAQHAFGNGFRCTVVDIERGAVVGAAGNVATYTYDNSTVKHSLGQYVGVTRHFQYWHRDPAAGGSFFNTSNAISIAILP